MDYKIQEVKSKKKKIFQRRAMKDGIIPKHPTTSLFVGRTNSGKSCLAANLLSRPQFYGKDPDNPKSKNYFHEIVLMGPTAEKGGDDMWDFLEDQNTKITRVSDVKAEDIQKIIKAQKSAIKSFAIEKAPRVLIIYEDLQVHSVGKNSILKSKPFLETFLANRHIGVSVFMLGQSYTATPRRCRLQARAVFYFPGAESELLCIAKEYGHPALKFKEMCELINYCTNEPYHFLFVNMSRPWKDRFRKNLDEILEIGN